MKKMKVTLEWNSEHLGSQVEALKWVIDLLNKLEYYPTPKITVKEVEE